MLLAIRVYGGVAIFHQKGSGHVDSLGDIKIFCSGLLGHVLCCVLPLMTGPCCSLLPEFPQK